MFKVVKKEKTANIVWDEKAGKPLCRFVNGVFETDDKELADRLKGMGHQVVEEVDAEKPVEVSHAGDKKKSK